MDKKDLKQFDHQSLSQGQEIAEFFARLVRSWKFVIFQLFFIAFWIYLNVSKWCPHWDKYPFDILKLILTIEASFTASMILMSQNRKSEMDRKILYMEYLMEKDIKKNIKKIKLYLKNIQKNN